MSDLILQNANGILNVFLKAMYGGHDSDQHTVALLALAVQMRAKNILELGVRDGDTTEPLLIAANLNGGNLVSVDIDQTRWAAPDHLKNNWKFIQQDAIQFLTNMVGERMRFDLIFVDDLHKYDHVKKELELIEKIADERTVVVLHDLMGEGNAPNYFLPISPHYNDQVWAGGGPFRAVNELDKGVWEWSTIPVNHGLTILRKRSKVVTPFA